MFIGLVFFWGGGERLELIMRRPTPPMIDTCVNVESSVRMGFLVGDVTSAHGVCSGLAGLPDRHRDR